MTPHIEFSQTTTISQTPIDNYILVTDGMNLRETDKEISIAALCTIFQKYLKTRNRTTLICV